MNALLLDESRWVLSLWSTPMLEGRLDALRAEIADLREKEQVLEQVIEERRVAGNGRAKCQR